MMAPKNIYQLKFFDHIVSHKASVPEKGLLLISKIN